MSRLRTHLAEAAPAARTWTPPANAVRLAWVHLTPFAPACADLPMEASARWRTLDWKTPAQVLRMVLARVQRTPAHVELVRCGEAVEIREAGEERRALALVWIDPPESLVEAHAALTAGAEVITLADRRPA